jgi:hypothetical protein
MDIAYCPASHSLAFSRVSNNLMFRPVSLIRDWTIIHLTPVTPTTAMAFMYGVVDLIKHSFSFFRGIKRIAYGKKYVYSFEFNRLSMLD